jgi:hypothetical protein
VTDGTLGAVFARNVVLLRRKLGAPLAFESAIFPSSFFLSSSALLIDWNTFGMVGIYSPAI